MQALTRTRERLKSKVGFNFAGNVPLRRPVIGLRAADPPSTTTSRWRRVNEVKLATKRHEKAQKEERKRIPRSHAPRGNDCPGRSAGESLNRRRPPAAEGARRGASRQAFPRGAGNEGLLLSIRSSFCAFLCFFWPFLIPFFVANVFADGPVHDRADDRRRTLPAPDPRRPRRRRAACSTPTGSASTATPTAPSFIRIQCALTACRSMTHAASPSASAKNCFGAGTVTLGRPRLHGLVTALRVPPWLRRVRPARCPTVPRIRRPTVSPSPGPATSRCRELYGICRGSSGARTWPASAP